MEIRSAEFVAGVASPEQLPPASLPEIAFVGRSNVGKSSLINMVLKRRSLARTSSAPGKTRQFNYYRLNDALYLVDLPGLGYAKVSRRERARWAREIASYLTSRQTLRLAFHLIDGRHPMMPADVALVDLYRRLDVPVVVVLTKTDKLSKNRRPRSERLISEALLERGLELPVIPSSARTGLGRDAILEWMDLAGERTGL